MEDVKMDQNEMFRDVLDHAELILRSQTTANTSGTTQHEQLSDLMTRITPLDTPLLVRLKRDGLYAPTHMWTEESITTGYTGLKFSEGGTPSDVTPTVVRKQNPIMGLGAFARATNMVRLFYQVAGDALARELQSNLNKVTKGIEYYLWNGTSGTANEFSGVLEWIQGSHVTGCSSTGALPEADLQNAITAIYNDSGFVPTHIFAVPEVAYRIANFTKDLIRVPAGGAPGGVTSQSMFYYSPLGNMLEVVPVRSEHLPSGNVVVLTAPLLTVKYAGPSLVQVEEIPMNEADVLSIRIKSYLSLEMRAGSTAHFRISGVSSRSS